MDNIPIFISANIIDLDNLIRNNEMVWLNNASIYAYIGLSAANNALANLLASMPQSIKKMKCNGCS